MVTNRGTFLRRLIAISTCLLLARASVAAAGTAGVASPETVEWFQATEQALMDALAPGDKAVWDRIMDPSCVVTSEEGQVLTRERFLEELGPLPQGLSGSIAVKDLTVQELPGVAVLQRQDQ